MAAFDPVLFALGTSRILGAEVAAALGRPLGNHEEREFEYGHHKARPLINVRERDVYVLHSLHGEPGCSVNDKLCRLLFFAGACRDAGAARITAIAPFLCYSRKDRKTKARDPVSTRYVARLFEAVEVDRVVTLDVHDLAAYQNAFRCRTEHLEARPLFVDWVRRHHARHPLAVVSPDAGGVARAERLRSALEQELDRPVAGAFMEKQRSEDVVSGDEALAGEVQGRVALIVDDMISSGATIVRCARACRAGGALEVHALATHAAFTPQAVDALVDPALDRVVVTDGIRPHLPRAVMDEKLVRLPTAPLLAAVIERLHTGGSLVALLEDFAPESPALPRATPDAARRAAA